jgi:DNA-directed RNA polymerase specialized sigma24 family protein
MTARGGQRHDQHAQGPSRCARPGGTERRRRRFLGRWIGGPTEIVLGADPDQARDLALREALRALPPAQRATLVLHLYAGYSMQETADLLDVPLETARSRIRLARTRMRAALDDRR